MATFVPRIAPQVWGASRAARQGTGTAGTRVAPVGQGGSPGVGEGPWSPWAGGCGPHGQGAMAPVGEELRSP